MCAPVAVTVGGALTTGSPLLIGYVVGATASVGALLVVFRDSIKRLFSRSRMGK
ncbi:MAG: hypothetical protein N2V77_05795 [Canidatus Methanoxibalbensis ujae]|nr:hypothetical protein [Candidatus Methanoxibalbensis ujae]MCW7079221.1 hypothetical protein [Candidatus Methanoxibalbensis ujae]